LRSLFANDERKAFTFLLARTLGKTVEEIGRMSEYEFQEWQVYAQYRQWQRQLAHDDDKVLVEAI
jgi:hypothetical protein